VSVRILGRGTPHWGVRASRPRRLLPLAGCHWRLARQCFTAPQRPIRGTTVRKRSDGGLHPAARPCFIGPVSNLFAGASPDVHRDSRTHTAGNPFRRCCLACPSPRPPGRPHVAPALCPDVAAGPRTGRPSDPVLPVILSATKNLAACHWRLALQRPTARHSEDSEESRAILLRPKYHHLSACSGRSEVVVLCCSMSSTPALTLGHGTQRR